MLNLLKMIGAVLCAMLIGGTCGFLLESMPRALFRDRNDMWKPGLILAAVFTLVFTFLTPLGSFFFNLFSTGNTGGTFVIFGGPVPLPFIPAFLGFMVLILLGAAASIILLCLLDILTGALRKQR